MNSNLISRPHLKLQGRRPTALAVSKNSKKTVTKKKPSSSINPVIVYLISPKIIHVQPEEFMGLVQRLTGNQQVRRQRRVNNIVNNSQFCSNSSSTSTSGLLETSISEFRGERADYADVPIGIPTTAT